MHVLSSSGEDMCTLPPPPCVLWDVDSVCSFCSFRDDLAGWAEFMCVCGWWWGGGVLGVGGGGLDVFVCGIPVLT